MRAALLAWLLSAASPAAATGALFDADAGHPWNRLHRALFDREVTVGRPACALQSGGCGGLSPSAALTQPAVGQRVLVGGDEPLAFIGGDVWFLEEPRRNAEALAALAAARAVDPRARPLAAALLQADVWERFDAIVDWLAHGQPKDRAALERLLPPLAALIGRLALPRATLLALPGNEGELARAFPSLLPGLAARDGWLEIRSDYTDAPTDPWRSTTRHSERWDHRVVFRVLVRAAGGAAWLHANVAPNLALPAGSTLLLLGAPLALSTEGELVALPVVTLAELRRALEAPATTVATLPHEVLEATRAGLLQTPRVGGGFVQVAGEALVPMGATCMPNRTTTVPMKLACVTCHGFGATRLTGPLAHGQLHVSVEGDPRAAERATIAAKLASPGYRRLRALMSLLGR